jgi:hypothetical protein
VRERREGAALLGEARGLVMGLFLDEAHEALGEGESLLGVVGDVQLEEEVGPAHHPEPHPPVGLHGGLDLRERVRIHLDHVVEEPHGEPHHALQLVPVQSGGAARSLAHEACDVHRAEVARVVRGQWLFTTVVHHEAVRHEALREGLLQVVDRRDPVGNQRIEARDERLAVRATRAGLERGLETVPLALGQESDLQCEASHIVTADDEIVVGLPGVGAVAPAAVGQYRLGTPVTVSVDPARDPEAEKHTLDVPQQGAGHRRQPDGHAPVGMSAHVAVGGEERLEESTLEIFGGR